MLHFIFIDAEAKTQIKSVAQGLQVVSGELEFISPGGDLKDLMSPP